MEKAQRLLRLALLARAHVRAVQAVAGDRLGDVVELVRRGDVGGDPPVAAPRPLGRHGDRAGDVGRHRDHRRRRVVALDEAAEHAPDRRHHAVGAEVRRGDDAAVAVDVLAVAVDEADLGARGEDRKRARELVRQPLVVGVEHRDEPAAGGVDRAVHADGRAAALLAQDADRVAEGLEDLERPVGRPVVDGHDLDGALGEARLGERACDGALDVGGVVERGHHAGDQRRGERHTRVIGRARGKVERASGTRGRGR